MISTSQPANTVRVLGMISGTSHDGIDTAIVAFTRTGDTLIAAIEHSDTIPYPARLRADLAAALPPAPIGFDTVARLDTHIGHAFAAAATTALQDHTTAGGAPVDLICTHGQTVFHWVDGAHALGTLQIGQPAWIGEATGLPVVSDIRTADIAAGGHGAPLVPILDQLLLAPDTRAGQRTGALNLGGIANITVAAAGQDPIAWDIGPANALIDAAIADDQTTPDVFDRDGALGAAGIVHPELLAAFLAEPYYALPVPKSSGKELFHGGYVRHVVDSIGLTPTLPDLVATLTAVTATIVADAIRAAQLDRVIVSGGGVRNPTLMAAIRDRLPNVPVDTSDALGIPVDSKEAVAFALIGWATLHGLPGNVPSCTGARQPRILGRISNACRPLSLPTSLQQWPTTLTVQETS
ncbi:anhydro-N-acetylmuramic acid kinase [Curtobacterium luteum]|uniref:anhydro-N-acetylmuramic acid kinase n=1 Tax=Curtobacterium luteum TaxID=33881 RepID=UPI00382694DF